MKLKKSIVITLVLALVSLFAVVGCSPKPTPDPEPTPEPAPAATITLDKVKAELDVYETLVLTATKENTDAEIVWSTSNASVATVADGTVTAVAEGSVTITATAGEASAKCEVTVTNSHTAPVLRIERDSVAVARGGSYELAVTTLWKGEPIGESVEYVWTVGEDQPDDVASVENTANGAVIKGLKYGETEFYVTANVRGTKLIKKVAVKVCNIDISFEVGGLTPSAGAYVANVALVDTETDRTTLDIDVKVYNKGTLVDGAAIEWTNSDDTKATIAGNTVTAVAEGETLLVGTYDNNDIKVLVKVYRPEISLSERVMIESAVGSFTVDSPLEGSITGARLGGKEIASSVDGATITVNKENFPSKAQDMGEQELIIDTDKAVYTAVADVYTKVLRTADDVMTWNDVAYEVDSANTYWGGYFVLGNDIDMSGKTYVGKFYYANMFYTEGPSAWSAKPEYSGITFRDGKTGGFRGVFDGQGYAIKNLTISQGNGSFAGQIAEGGVFKNVVFTGAKITSNWGAGLVSVGGIGTIENVYAEITEMKQGNSNADKNGVFYAQDSMSGAKVNNCIAVFNCTTPTDPSRFTGLGSYHLGYGILNGVYGIGLDPSLAIREISAAGAGDSYGAYAGYGALYASGIDFSEWEDNFWRVVNGVPYPKSLALPAATTPAATIGETVGAGTTVEIRDLGINDVVRLSDEAAALGVTVGGNKIVIPASVRNGTVISFTVYNVFDATKSVELTSTVVESKTVAINGKTDVVIEDGATFTVNFGDQKDEVEGEVSIATIDGKTFTTATYADGVLTLDTATLKSLYGEKHMSVMFNKMNGAVIEKVTVVEITLDVTTMVIRTEADLNRFLTVAQENKIGASWAGIYKLANDITCTGDYAGVSGSGDPRGAFGTATGFNGTFDGQGHTIYNINIVGAQTGFASYLGQHGVIKNVAFVGARNNCVGGFITSSLAGTIENVYIQMAQIDDNKGTWANARAAVASDNYGQGRINKVFVEYVKPLADGATTGYPMWHVNIGYGCINGVYAVGVSKFAHSESKDGEGDKYGVYADYAALKAAAVDFTDWDGNGFWKVVNGIPVPASFTAKATLTNTELGVAADSTIALGCSDTYVTIAIDDEAKAAGFALVGRTLVVPADAAGKTVTVTVTSVIDATVKVSKTFTVITTEIKNVADVTEIDMTATGNLTFDLSAQSIDGELVSAKLDGTAFSSAAYEAGTLTLDRATLGSLYGEKTIVATFEKRSGDTLEKIVTVNIPVILVTKYITTNDELKNLLSYTLKIDDVTRGGYFVQTADLDAGGARVGFGEWGGDAVGSVNCFNGVYDGRGHVIQGAKQGTNTGMFAWLRGNSVIKNIVFTGAVLDGCSGFVVTDGAEGSTIENIAVYGKIVSGGASWSPSAMILGKGNGATVRNCMVVLTDWAFNFGNNAGMIVGNLANVNSVIENCVAVNLKSGATEAEYAIPAIGKNGAGLTTKANDNDTTKTFHGWDEYLAWAADKDMSAYGNSTWEVLENKIPVAKSVKASVGAVNADFVPDTVAAGEATAINITNAGMYAKVTVEPAVEGVTVGFSTINVADTFSGSFTVKVTSLVTGEEVSKTVKSISATALTTRSEIEIGKASTIDISEAGITGTVQSAKVNDTDVTSGITLSETSLSVNITDVTIWGEKTIRLVIEKNDGALVALDVPVLAITKVLTTADDVLGWNELAYSADKSNVHWAGYFVLGNDVDLTGKNYEGKFAYYQMHYTMEDQEAGLGSAWSPRTQYAGYNWGALTCGFRGTFDGRGHVIKNINVTWYLGSFAGQITTGGVVKNVAFTGVKLAGAASLISAGGTGRIENVYAEVTSASAGNGNDRGGVFFGQNSADGASINKSFVKFNCNAVLDRFTILGSLKLGSGMLNEVYAIGTGITTDNVLRSIGGTTNDGDVYGGYADGAALTAAGVTFTSWEGDFWTTTADGLPIPKSLNA